MPRRSRRVVQLSAELAAAQPQRADTSAVGAMGRRLPPWSLFIFVTIPVIVLDQLTKQIVRAHMELYQSIALVNHYLDLTYTQNPGAAFSMLASAPPWVREAFLLSLSATAIVVLGVLIAFSARVSVTSLAFALICGGAMGNLIDRAIRGRVIDFIRAHYYDWNFPVFNVADSAITIGVSLIILISLFGMDDPPAPTHQ
jgi:signal peptidase II